MAKPMKILELYYPMIQFINSIYRGEQQKPFYHWLLAVQFDKIQLQRTAEIVHLYLYASHQMYMYALSLILNY